MKKEPMPLLRTLSKLTFQRYWLVFLSMLTTVALQAQSKQAIDSLRGLITTSHDTVRMEVYFQLSMKYQNNNRDSAIHFAEQAIEESRALKYKKGEADGLISLGRITRDNGEFAKGLELISQSLEIYRSIDNRVQIANAYNDISIIYAMSQDYENALDYFAKALEMFEVIRNEKGISQTLNNMGIVYQELGRDTLAIDYYSRSLVIKEKIADTQGLAIAYVNMGTIMEDYELKSEALRYYFKADSAFKLVNDQRGVAKNQLYIANIFLKSTQFNKAWQFAQSSYDIAGDLELLLVKQDALSVMVDVKEKVGDYFSALTFQKRYQDVTDSILTAKNLAVVEELKAKFDANEKDREIETLRKDKELELIRRERQSLVNYLLILGLISALIVLSILWVAFMNNKRKNRVLLSLNQEKDQFISILSHDIKSPLNTLKAFSNLLTTAPERLSEQEIQACGGKINSSLDSMTKLVDNVLEWSLSRKHLNNSQPVRVDISELLADVINLYHLVAKEKNVEIINEVKCKQLLAFADKNALYTVLRNLVSNAIKFSKSGDVVKISASRDDNKMKIVVSDTGMGIEKELLPILFDFSKQKVRSGTANESGTGLGLALSKELIEANRGTLEVDSIYGIGSQFHITVPACS